MTREILLSRIKKGRIISDFSFFFWLIVAYFIGTNAIDYAESHWGDKFRTIWAPALVILTVILCFMAIFFTFRQVWKALSLVCPHCQKVCFGKTKSSVDMKNNVFLSEGRCCYCNKIVFELSETST